MISKNFKTIGREKNYSPNGVKVSMKCREVEKSGRTRIRREFERSTKEHQEPLRSQRCVLDVLRAPNVRALKLTFTGQQWFRGTPKDDCLPGLSDFPIDTDFSDFKKAPGIVLL